MSPKKEFNSTTLGSFEDDEGILIILHDAKIARAGLGQYFEHLLQVFQEAETVEFRIFEGRDRKSV